MHLQNLSDTIFFPLTLAFLLLLVIPGYSLQPSNIPGPATHDPPERLNNLTEECLQINAPMLFISMFTFSELGPRPEVLSTDHMYRVHLKAFTSHSDTLEILKRPSLRSIVPTAVYNQGKDRGFVANLTYEQVCEIYKLPTVFSPSGNQVLKKLIDSGQHSISLFLSKLWAGQKALSSAVVEFDLSKRPGYHRIDPRLREDCLVQLSRFTAASRSSCRDLLCNTQTFRDEGASGKTPSFPRSKRHKFYRLGQQAVGNRDGSQFLHRTLESNTAMLPRTST